MFRLLAIIVILAGYAAMSAIRDGIRRGATAFGFLKAWKQNRKERRDGTHPGDSDVGEFLDDDKETPVLEGKKTYLGIAVAALGLILGWLGLGDDSAALSGQIIGAIDQVLTVGGLVLAAYGRAKAKPAA